MKKLNKNNSYEGKKYKFKENSLKKIQNKYQATFLFLLLQILENKKVKKFQNKLIKEGKENSVLDNLILEIVETTGEELNIDKNKVYNYKKYNNKLKKALKTSLKKERKTKENSKNNLINNYKKILEKNYQALRKLAFKNPNDFLKVIYLHTICED